MCVISLIVFYFFKVGPPKEDIFLTTFYGLYIEKINICIELTKMCF